MQEVSLSVLGFLLTCVQWIIAPYFWVKARLPASKLPPPASANSHLLTISATKLAEKIRKQELTSVEIVEAYIARINQVNPFINAVVEDRFAEALKEARNADLEIKSCTSKDALAQRKPLLGVPLTVKESCRVKGMSFTVGSLPRKDWRATEDGGAVALMRRSGAVILAVTNTPEYCVCCETYNHVTGRTSNPYDLRRSCSGSSGGEGALLGCGATCISVGSDIAGSVRIPAMWCGVFGHKPTAGATPVVGHFPMCPDADFHNYLSIGPMTRYAEDLATMLQIMSGDKATTLRLSEKIDLSKLKVFYMKESGNKTFSIPVQEEIKKAVQDAANHLQSKCNSVKEVRVADFKNAFIYSYTLLMGIYGKPDVLADCDNPKNTKNIYVETLKFALRLSDYSWPGLAFSWLLQTQSVVTPSGLQTIKRRIAELKKQITNMLGDDGVLLYPTFPTSAVLHYESYVKLIGAVYTAIFNLLGLPSTSVPMGRDASGLPIGIQVVGAPNQDRLCLAVARELEKAFGGWAPPTYQARN